MMAYLQSRRIVSTNVPFFDMRLGSTLNIAQTGVGITLPLGTSRANYQSCYDTGNYTFTAPNDGIFLFVWMISVDNADSSGSYVGINITTSNYGEHTWENINQEHPAQTYASWSGNHIAFMDANDTSTMTLSGSGTVDWGLRGGDCCWRGVQLS